MVLLSWDFIIADSQCGCVVMHERDECALCLRYFNDLYECKECEYLVCHNCLMTDVCLECFKIREEKNV